MYLLRTVDILDGGEVRGGLGEGTIGLPRSRGLIGLGAGHVDEIEESEIGSLDLSQSSDLPPERPRAYISRTNRPIVTYVPR